MKKLSFLLIAFVLVFMISGCASVGIDNSLLQAGEGTVDPLLPHLKISSTLERNMNLINSNTNSLKSNSYMYTIFERELEENIIDPYGDVQGSIELVITNATYSQSYNLLMFIAMCGPGLVGFPAGSTKTAVEFEIRIYDNDDNRVWKKIYSDSNIGMLTMYNEDQDGTNLIIKEYKEQLEFAKQDLQRDREQIIERLLK
jgi:hypothetical protein